MDAIRQWILQLTGASMITAAVMALLPKGRMQKAVRVVCGFFLMAILLSIGIKFDETTLTRFTAAYRDDAAALAEETRDAQDVLTRSIIEAETAAYILDKGDELGVADASVTAKWSTDGYWYPAVVHITANCTETQKQELEWILESELGIARENQRWSYTNERAES